MAINNLTLAYLFNDLENVQDYKIDGNDCYYKDEFIGEINGDVLDIYFKPVKPLEHIDLNITIGKPSKFNN